jgi:hypothetical protein
MESQCHFDLHFLYVQDVDYCFMYFWPFVFLREVVNSILCWGLSMLLFAIVLFYKVGLLTFRAHMVIIFITSYWIFPLISVNLSCLL